MAIERQRLTTVAVSKKGKRVIHSANLKGDLTVLRDKTIAVFVWGFPKTSEPWIVNHIVELIKAGCNVKIFALEYDPNNCVNSDVAKYELQKRVVQLEKVPRQRLKRLLKATSIIVGRGWRNPAAVLRSLNVHAFRREALSLRLLYWGGSLGFKQSFDLVHCHFGPIGNIAVRLRSIGIFDCPIVTTFHGIDVNVIPKVEENGYYKRLFRDGELFTAVSVFAKRKLLKLGVPGEQCILWPMGVNTSRFSAELSQAKDSVLRILSVGRLIEAKGFQYGIKALGILRAQGCNVEYSIVGDGPIMTQLKKMSEELAISDHIKFLGSKEYQDMPEIFQAADIVLVPSVVDDVGTEDAFPVVVLEAEACGKPVVGSAVGGIPEAVDKGETGFVVPPESPEAIADACKTLLKDRLLLRSMGRASRMRALRLYDANLLYLRMFHVYAELIAEYTDDIGRIDR